MKFVLSDNSSAQLLMVKTNCCQPGDFFESGPMLTNFKTHILVAIEFKSIIRIKNNVANCSVRIKQTRENNICVYNYFLHLMKRLRFFFHQTFFTSLASLSTCSWVASELEVASLYVR